MVMTYDVITTKLMIFQRREEHPHHCVLTFRSLPDLKAKVAKTAQGLRRLKTNMTHTRVYSGEDNGEDNGGDKV